MSQNRVLHPRHAGDNAEAAVIERLSQLQYVPDTEAEHYDARLVEPLTVSDVRIFGACQLNSGTSIEIKSAIVVLGSGERGRFYLRRKQHSRLVEDDSWYCFTVCEPTPQRNPISIAFVAANQLDSLINSWIRPDGREPYAQLAWSRIFGESIKGGGVTVTTTRICDAYINQASDDTRKATKQTTTTGGACQHHPGRKRPAVIHHSTSGVITLSDTGRGTTFAESRIISELTTSTGGIRRCT